MNSHSCWCHTTPRPSAAVSGHSLCVLMSPVRREHRSKCTNLCHDPAWLGRWTSNSVDVETVHLVQLANGKEVGAFYQVSVYFPENSTCLKMAIQDATYFMDPPLSHLETWSSSSFDCAEMKHTLEYIILPIAWQCGPWRKWILVPLFHPDIAV